MKLRGREFEMNKLIRFFKDESGASAAEYALILAIVGAAIAFAAVTLGGAIANAMDNATACINNPPSSAGASCT
jgi:pilus assembly protein Flp/PilA